jgi:hypothetical protein
MLRSLFASSLYTASKSRFAMVTFDNGEDFPGVHHTFLSEGLHVAHRGLFQRSVTGS